MYIWELEPGDATRYTVCVSDSYIGFKVGQILVEEEDGRPLIMCIIRRCDEPIHVNQIENMYHLDNRHTALVAGIAIAELFGRKLLLGETDKANLKTRPNLRQNIVERIKKFKEVLKNGQ